MIKFGTSGYRGIIGDSFTKENVQRVAFAVTQVMTSDDVIPIGFDNRFMGKFFAEWFAEVLTAYGKKVKFFTKPMPSPLIAFETKEKEFGFIITASHNPYYYSGIKAFQRGGRELTKEQNEKLAKLANKVKEHKIKTLTLLEAEARGLVTYSDDIKPYCDSVISKLDSTRLKTSKIVGVFDAMNGSSVECTKYIAKKLGITLQFLRANIDPNFGFSLPAPYEKNLDGVASLVAKSEKATFGFAFDGDGDRASFVDENGVFYDCNYISAVVYDYVISSTPCDFVKNCAMTALIDKIAEVNNRQVFLAEVGFKNTAEQMLKNDGVLIGAESNGMAFKDNILFKDGIFLAFYVAQVLAKNKMGLGELIQKTKKKYNYPCQVVEYAYPFNDEERSYIEKVVFKNKILPEVDLKVVDVSYADGLKITYEGGYWGVIRFSGNENVIRLFAEMPTRKQAEKVIAAYEDLIGLTQRQI